MSTYDTEQNSAVSDETALQPIDTTQQLAVVDTTSLKAESKEIITKIIQETSVEKTKDLTQLFNANQNKKTLVRMNKMNDLMDALTDQALARLTSRPDEISNQELLQGMKTVQDLIERGQKQAIETVEEPAPLIQINQQNNELHLGADGANISRESREKVKNAVLSILQNIQNQNDSIVPADAIIDATVVADNNQDNTIIELKDNEDDD